MYLRSPAPATKCRLSCPFLIAAFIRSSARCWSFASPVVRYADRASRRTLIRVIAPRESSLLQPNRRACKSAKCVCTESVSATGLSANLIRRRPGIWRPFPRGCPVQRGPPAIPHWPLDSSEFVKFRQRRSLHGQAQVGSLDTAFSSSSAENTLHGRRGHRDARAMQSRGVHARSSPW